MTWSHRQMKLKNCSKTPEVMELDDSTDNMPNSNVKAAGEAVDILSSRKEPEENTDKTERDGNFFRESVLCDTVGNKGQGDITEEDLPNLIKIIASNYRRLSRHNNIRDDIIEGCFQELTLFQYARAIHKYCLLYHIKCNNCGILGDCVKKVWRRDTFQHLVYGDSSSPQ